MRAFLLLCVFALSTPVLSLYSPGGPVEVLTAADFKKKVIDSKESWIVEFYASWCGHCKQLAPEFEKAAKALKGIVRVGAIEDQAIMGQYGVQGFPTIKYFSADNKSKAQDYSGARTAQGLVDYSLGQISGLAKGRLSGKSSSGKKKDKKSSGSSDGKSDVIVLTDSNFEKEVMQDDKSAWFIEFYAPWCGHCKTLAPAWEELATNLKGKIKVAKVDATVENAIGQKFGVKGFPTIKMFPAGKKTISDAQTYEGPRTVDGMAEYALSFFVAASAEQLTSQTMLEETCGKGLCVVAMLPNIIDSSAAQRNQYLADFNVVVKGSGKHPIKFLWSEGGAQYELEEQLALSFGYPALIAVHLEKGYAIHRGDFSQQSIRSFISQIMSRSASIQPVPKGGFKKVATVKPWDGKDAPPPPPEEKFDLNDEL